MSTTGVSFREGSTADLATTFSLQARALHDTAVRQGVIPAEEPPSDAEIAARWRRERPLAEFLAAQPGGSYWICCDGDEQPIGYARVVRFEGVEELTELVVDADHRGRGIARGLLERCWPGDPSPELLRVVVAAGAPADLSLYTTRGVMPVAGHWHLRQRTETYLERRAQELDVAEPDVHVLTPERAVAEWHRLEPIAIGHGRPRLHEFFGRDRTCLACVDAASGRASALCWVGGDEIGPAVAEAPGDLVPVTLAALDRVAKTREPAHLSVFATTISWWLLRRLRGLGFRVRWPSWVMGSTPLPGLDRYAPTRPPRLL